MPLSPSAAFSSRSSAFAPLHAGLSDPHALTSLVIMTTVSVTELKAKLSAYLREVRRGGEVQILDRGEPVARLVPVAAGIPGADPDAEQRRQRLIATGALRPGNGIDPAALPLPLSVDLGRALDHDRSDRL